MQWSETHRELVSSHGFSDNQLCLWKLTNGDNLVKLKEFRGHTARVLHMAKSPDGKQIVTAGADESLRFWDLFNSPVGAGGNKAKQSRLGLMNSPMLGNSMGGMVLR
jgi:cell division cycle 20, cofactor of APC complex